MNIILIIYIAIGILSILVGPISNRIKRDILDLKVKLSLEAAAGIKTASKRRVLMFEVFYGILLIDYYRSKKRAKNKTTAPANDYLYFRSGTGVISCKDCGFTQQIVSFLHGLDDGESTLTGFQCQAYGKFHELKNSLGVPVSMKCECGSVLSRKELLFCPTCRSKKVSYKMSYIT
jgi:hypothetical protein